MRLPEFLEYLDYFQQAGGTLSLEDDSPGDAVQLMTVHGAKGLEFPHVFLLRVNSNAFPARNRSPLFEFPDRLMKEELPEGDFHIQEERRLFYVALTRAEDRLTITTVTEKKGKVPVFVEDIVMDPTVKRKDVLQLAPKRRSRPTRRRLHLVDVVTPELFPASEEPPKDFLAHREVGRGVLSTLAGTVEAERIGGGELPQVPAAIRCSATCGRSRKARARR